MNRRPPSVDPRVRLAIAFAAWGVALGAPHPVTAAAVAALAMVVRLRRPRALPALMPSVVVAVTAALLLAAARGGEAAMRVPARIVAAGWVGSALISSLSRSELLGSLAWARVPPPLLELFATADRQRHALAAFVGTVRDAQRLRLGWTGARRALRSAGALAGLSLLQAFSQAELTSDALALRGAHARPAPPLQSVAGWGNAILPATATLALAGCLLLPRLLPT